jgi:periplasmic protein TonB
MSAVLSTAAGTTDPRALVRCAFCLAVVVAAHIAVLALLPAGTQAPSPPPAPMTVTLITPPAAPKVMASAAAAQKPRPREVERALERPKPAKERPAQPKVQSAPKPPLAPKADTQPADNAPVVPPLTTPLPPATSGSAADTQVAMPSREADPPMGDRAGSTAPEKLLPPRFDAAYLDNPKPQYPRLARRLGEHGTVLLNVYVDANGLPEKIELHASSGSPRLDQAARETVSRWKFIPARQGERPVGAWMVVPIRFVLEN